MTSQVLALTLLATLLYKPQPSSVPLQNQPSPQVPLLLLGAI